MLRTTVIAAAALAFSSMAQADTVKQIWNQELGEGNPGRVESTGECLQEDFSRFGCWNDSRDRDLDAGSAGGAEEPPTPPPNGEGEGEGEGPGNGQNPV